METFEGSAEIRSQGYFFFFFFFSFFVRWRSVREGKAPGAAEAADKLGTVLNVHVSRSRSSRFTFASAGLCMNYVFLIQWWYAWGAVGKLSG